MTKEELEKEARERADKIEKRQKRCRHDIDESYVAGYEDGYIAGAEAHSIRWHKIFVDSEPYKCEYWDLPQDTLPEDLNFYFVKLKNGFIEICELKYDITGRKKCFYDLHGWKQSDVAEWMEYPKE